MKALHMDFVPRSRWRAIWIIAAAGMVALAVAYLPSFWKLYQYQRASEQSITLLRQQATPPVASGKPPIDPRLGHARQTADLLQRDLNGVFALIENMQEPNVRLRNLSFDSVGNMVRLEYELDSMPRASSVTLALNTGYINSPWLLESINTVSINMGQQQGFPTAYLFRALWSADLRKL
jgi:hypothetical protein